MIKYSATQKLLRDLKINKSVMVKSASQKSVSAIFTKFPDKKFSSENMLVISPKKHSLETYFLVTRIR